MTLTVSLADVPVRVYVTPAMARLLVAAVNDVPFNSKAASVPLTAAKGSSSFKALNNSLALELSSKSIAAAAPVAVEEINMRLKVLSKEALTPAPALFILLTRVSIVSVLGSMLISLAVDCENYGSELVRPNCSCKLVLLASKTLLHCCLTWRCLPEQ